MAKARVEDDSDVAIDRELLLDIHLCVGYLVSLQRQWKDERELVSLECSEYKVNLSPIIQSTQLPSYNRFLQQRRLSG